LAENFHRWALTLKNVLALSDILCLDPVKLSMGMNVRIRIRMMRIRMKMKIDTDTAYRIGCHGD
jgi:hypothetical protein